MKSRTLVKLLLPPLIISLLLLPPYFLATSTFPLAIVEGSSMVPTFRNGDVVMFRGMQGANRNQNGSIIVYFSGETGILGIDYMIRPVVIHRVINTVVQSDGVVYYRTKGDNNQLNDPLLVREGNVLGTPIGTLPYLGSFILFLKSPQGIIFALGIFSLLFMSRVESKLADDKVKRRLVGSLARMTLNGQIRAKQFERLKLVVEYADEIPVELLKNPAAVALADWLRSGRLSEGWKEEDTTCPQCQEPAVRISQTNGTHFLVCQTCADMNPQSVTRPILASRPLHLSEPLAFSKNLTSTARVIGTGDHGDDEILHRVKPRFQIDEIVDLKGDWRRVMEVRENEPGVYAYKLKDVWRWKEEGELRIASIPPPKHDVGETIKYDGRNVLVRAKRFDLERRRWMYTLAPSNTQDTATPLDRELPPIQFSS